MTLAPVPGFSLREPPPMRPEDEALKQAQLRHMKRLATGMLLVSTAIFIVARLFEPQFPWLGFVRATAEAAMIGGLADWFAVTALFRHPLGIPIPHTAIVAGTEGSGRSQPRQLRAARTSSHVKSLPFGSVNGASASIWPSGWPRRTTAAASRARLRAASRAVHGCYATRTCSI